MPRRAATAALLLLLSTPAVAGRGHHGGPHDPAVAAQKLGDALGLDAPTTEAVRGILAEALGDARPIVQKLRDDLTALKAVRSSGAGVTGKVRRLVRKAARERADLLLLRMEALDAVRARLTPAQATKLDELKGKRGSDAELQGDGPVP